MTAFLIMTLAAQVSIQPTFQPPPIVQTPQLYELSLVAPIEWTCNLRSAVSKDFMISGQFDKPNIPKSHDYMVTRPVALRISGPRSVSANGVAGWDWSSRRDGSYWFEIKTPQIHYKVQMDFMEPGKKGYIRLLASHKLTPGVPTIWQLEGLGFCTTAAKVEGKTKQ